MTTRDLSRRAVLAGACGSCAVAVAGCATYTTGRAAPAAAPDPAAGFGASVTPEAGATAEDAPGADSSGKVATTDIPVGGGKIFADQDVVITQPTTGKFVAFSATCTHQGCSVSTITGNTVNCPCHGSKFALADGSVVNGPATSPLAKKTIKVAGGQITIA
jgi:Rieske Fe-S protein